MPLPEVREIVDELLSNGVAAADTPTDLIRYKHIADYYRLSAEGDLNEPRKISLNHLSRYPAPQFSVTVLDDRSREELVYLRDALKHYTDWAYRYGALKSEYSLPKTGDGAEETVPQLNEKITNTDGLTVNDMFLALKLASIIIDSEDSTDALTSRVFQSTAYETVTELADATQAIFEAKDEINWDMLGKTFDETGQFAQERLRETTGERRVLRELRNFEGESIDEFLEHY